MVSCSKDEAAFDNSETGVAGSTARFAVKNNYLYTVDNNSLNIYNVENPTNPVYVQKAQIGWDIETIFPKDSLLFFGSQSGMLIYSISNPTEPQFVTEFWHARGCDPVVVDNGIAYVTLRSNNEWCGSAENELIVYSVKYLFAVSVIRHYPMTAPEGLGIDDNLLFVCDNGLKVFDCTYPENLQLIKHFDINATDVIPVNGKLLVIGSDGFYQYDYTGSELILISKIPVPRGN